MKRISIKTIIALTATVSVLAGCREDTGNVLSVINVEEQMSISYEGGENVIKYTVENPVDGRTPMAESDQEWLHSFEYDVPGEIHFQAEPNMNDGARTANVTVSYEGAEQVIVTVRQLTSADAGDAVITLLTESPVSVPATGGDIAIEYRIDNYLDGTEIEVSCDETWAQDYDTPEYGKVMVHTQINFNTAPRTAVLTLSYPGAEPVTVQLEQAAIAGEPPFTIVVDSITETQVNVYWMPDDKEMTYANGLAPKSYMDEYEGNESEYIEDEILNFRYQAEQSGMSLEEYLSKVLRLGDVGVKWSNLEPATEYCAFAFALETTGEPLSGLAVERFQTRKVDQLDCTFSFEDAGTTATSLKVRVIPDNPNVRYYTGIVAKSEYDAWESDEAMMNLISDEIEDWIWIYQQNPQLGITATWSDYTEIGTSEVEAEKLFSSTGYYAYAFGLDEGLITTNLQKQLFTTEEVDITDNCTFDVDVHASASYMADMKIEPSNNSTRYYVEVVESSVAVQYSPDDMATLMLNSAVESGILDTYTYSGTQSLNTLYDMDVAPLTPSTDFTVFIFGVDNGCRTTRVATSQFRTGPLQPSSITFDLSVTDVTTSSVTIQCTPSNNNEYYVMGCISVDQYGDYGSDEAFMQAVVDYHVQSLFGIYGSVGCMGEIERNTTNDIFYGNIQAQTEYYAFAFGYMGDVTTGLTKIRFSTSGKVYSQADVTMECELINGADLYYEDPYRYPYEDYYNFAVFDFTFTPNQYADGWYFATINNASIDEVMRMDEQELIDIIRNQGDYKPLTARRREYWYTTIVAVVLPVDRYGEYGQMRIEEFYADPVAAGALSPAASWRGTAGGFMPSVQPMGAVPQETSGLRAWDGSELGEISDSNAGEAAGTVAMTLREAEDAMRGYLMRRFQINDMPEAMRLPVPVERPVYVWEKIGRK